MIVPAYLALAAVVVVGVGRCLGLEIFPKVDAGRFQLRMRAPDGTRIEETEKLAIEVLETIARRSGADNVEISIGYVGLIPSSYPINAIYQWTGGPEEVVLRVALKEGTKVDVEGSRSGSAPSSPRSCPSVRLSFEPADIVSEVMSFGSPTPVEVAVNGPNLADNRAFAEKLRAELAKVPSLRDLQFGQSLDYPTVSIEIDREKAGLSGVTVAEVARSVVAATSSSRFVVPNYWPDPKTGIGYQVQVEIPYQIMNSIDEVETMPIQKPGGDPLLLRDVAKVSPGTMPGEYDRYNMKRVVSLTANIAGEDLGRVAGHVDRAIARAGEPPKGATVDVRGQIAPMKEILRGLAIGLGMAIVVILLLLDGQLPVGPAGAGRRLDDARGGRRRGGHALADRDDGQPPVVHGGDHGHRRGGGQRDPAGDVRRAAPPRGRGGVGSGGRRRGAGPAAADPDDQLRHDRRHGADGAGLERRGRADRPAGPGGHRRPGRGDPRDPGRAAHRLRDGPGRRGTPVGLARPRRPRELALRPRALGRCRACRCPKQRGARVTS